MWSIEDYSQQISFTKDELECEKLYSQSISRDLEGRIVISLSFKTLPSALGNSRRQAYKRFLHLERKFSQNSDLHSLYVHCMNEYIDKEYMCEVTESHEQEVAHNILHLAVYKEFSTTTKMRVVFDASMKTSSSFSLNDILYNGPVVQPDMSHIICFRLPKYVFTADIAKMYLQIKMYPEHKVSKNILARIKKSQKLMNYYI